MSTMLQGRNRTLAVVGLAIVAIALAGCSKKNLRKPAELKDISNPAIKLQTVWTASAGDGGGKYYTELRLALEPDALFAADIDGRVYAFDPKTGERIWEARTHKRLVSGPTVSGDAVLAGTMGGEMVAVKRADGAPLWSSQLASEALSPATGDGNRIYMRSGDGKIYSLDADSGSQQWTVDRSEPSLTLRGLSPPVVIGTNVFIGLDNGRVLALHGSDGAVAWEQTVSAPTGRNELDRITDIDAPLLSDGGQLYAASFGGEIVCLDDQTGQVLWRHAVKSYSGIARIDNLVVVTDADGTVWGLDATTGTEKWKNDDLKYRQLSAPTIFKDYIVVGDYKGYLHWLDPKTGAIVARDRAGSKPIRFAPVVGDDMMYVLSSKGHIAAIKLRS
ncbi:outer membrane protein assembly factor BamB [Solimonas marina]|uniref:Outer membrane protein assembly factor BamB n=1 Tax=Solimonas marina TaxID=2714601 RepID=A0A969WEK7_9GAMM|nr:outer membrane protein assembly factor BamB [Solimonas marina]NKF24700.1 outer membrane protein assembly factor BamB [Solimonas marina]